MLFVSSLSVLDVGMVNGRFNWILRDRLSHTERDENEDSWKGHNQQWISAKPGN